MKIRPVGVEKFRADGRKNRHYEANSRFSQLFEYTQQLNVCIRSTKPTIRLMTATCFSRNM